MEDRSNLLKYFLIFDIVLVFLIFIIGGFFILTKTSKEEIKPPSSIKDKKTIANDSNSNQDSSQISTLGSFKGLKYYPNKNTSRSQSKKDEQFYVVEGKVSKIDNVNKKITITSLESSEDIEYKPQDKLFMLVGTNQEEINFSKIEIGNFISYTPKFENTNNAIWIVQKLN